MRCGLPVGQAAVSLVLAIASASAALSAPASAKPRESETGQPPEDAFERFLSGDTQCEFENRFAREHGGAIKRARPCKDPEAPEAGTGRPLERRLEDVKGKLRPPVTGEIVRLFGEKDGEGRPLAGITFRTRPGAQVVAPFESTITFAGPIEDFGQTLILSTGDGYHLVLAGMSKIYGVEGQKLLEGEPVGVMSATGTGGASSAGAGPELYFEIRKNRRPIDPLPWLATARLERKSQ